LFSYQFGGSERMGADLALEFKTRGYQVVCFAFHDCDGPMRAQLESAGIRCLDMNYEKFSGVLRRISYLWKFWRMLRRERVSALHVHHHGALIPLRHSFAAGRNQPRSDDGARDSGVKGRSGGAPPHDATACACPRGPPRASSACAASSGLRRAIFAFFDVGRLNPIKDLGTLLEAFAN